MNEMDKKYMSEEDARMRIETTFDHFQDDHTCKELWIDDDVQSVEYHIDNILKASGGMWNESIARDYLQSLEMQMT
jgi:hypothetical protein